MEINNVEILPGAKSLRIEVTEGDKEGEIILDIEDIQQMVIWEPSSLEMQKAEGRATGYRGPQ